MATIPSDGIPFPHHGEDEEWRPAHDGWATLYEVSSLGRVRSLDHISASGRLKRGRMLSLFLNVNGYQTVDLVSGETRERWPVHQLVARVFIGKRPKGQVCRHGPNGKLDNRASQLCYGTKFDDVQDKIRDKTAHRGEKQWMHKLTWESVAEIRRCAAAGERQCDIAERFGVTQPSVSMIVRGKTWRAWDSPNPEKRPSRRQPMTDAAVIALHGRYLAGEDIRALAAEIGCDRTSIYARFRRMQAAGKLPQAS